MEESEEVSTEPQRRALEEMSQALLGRLDEMLAEQARRSAEFAERTHSLSHLPELTPPVKPGEPVGSSAAYEPLAAPKPQPISGEAFAKPPTPPAIDEPAAPGRKVTPPPASSLKKAVKKAEKFINDSDWNGGFAQSFKSSPEKSKEQESGFGVGAVVFVIFVIVFFLRACQ